MSCFECKACGRCCKGEGSVFLLPDDVKTLAENLKMDIQKFVDTYTNFIMLELMEDEGTYFYMPYLVLKKNELEECLFLNDNRCGVHNFKPFQCRSTPFVPEFFSDKDWQKDVKASCFGLRMMDEADFEPYRENIEKEAEEREQRYSSELQDNGYSLEKILGVTLPPPEIIQFDDED